MPVRLAVSAVGAANRRFNHALAVFGRCEQDEAAVAGVRRPEGRGRSDGRGCVAGMARDRVAHERPEFLLRDVHRIRSDR